MGDFRAITLQSGHFDTVNDVDNLLVGMGVKSTISALTVEGISTITLKANSVAVFSSNGTTTTITGLAASNISSGTMATARLGSGTADATTFLRGDNSWAIPVGGGGGGTVTSVNLTAPAAGIAVSGGPVTTTGSITLALANDLAGLEGLAATGIPARTATDTWAVRTITGTTSRLTVTNGGGVAGDPTLDISTGYAGQTTITTLGTITAGTWTGTAVALANGGTGQTTQLGAANAVLPTQTANSGKYLTTDGTNVSWATAAGGTTQGRNILINGNFDIWQRATSFVTPATSQYTADRWRVRIGGTISTNVSRVISSGSNGPNAQAQNWIKFASNQSTVTEGNGGYGGENLEVLMLTQPLEVRQARRINNKQFTLSFWVRSSAVTGSLGVSFLGPSDTMGYFTTVNVSATNTWQQKTVTVSAQALTTTENEYDKGLTVGFVVYPGTGFNSTNTVNTWASALGNWFTTAAGNFHSSFNVLEIAQVQLEDGASATSFDYVWPEVEKRGCERYYQQVFVAGGMYNADTVSARTNYVSVPVFTKLRVAPTVTVNAVSMSSNGLSGTPTATASSEDNLYVTYIVNTSQNGYFNGLKLLLEADING